MKIVAAAAVLVLGAVQAQAARPIQVTLEWLNYAEQHCKGCKKQVVILPENSPAIFGEECAGGVVWIKILARWSGETIEVSLTREISRDEKTFADDGESKSVSPRAGESGQLALGRFKYSVSACAAPDEPSHQVDKLPNKSADSTTSAGTSAAEQPRVPASAASRL